MRRVAPFAVITVLLASAYALLRAEEKQPLPDPATSGAIVVDEPDREHASYKALTRNSIENLSAQADAPAAVRLTDGLNALADDGWELTAIEPPFTYRDTSAHGALKRWRAEEPPTYIFRKR